MSLPELTELSAAQAARRIARRELDSLELVEALLRQIERLEPQLAAWVHLDAEGARTAARHAAGDGPLAGVPLGVKDLFDVAGLPTAAGFEPFRERVAVEDARAVALLRAAGGIVLGKTVTTQFAFADPPPTGNPWHPDRTPGGSSSGSAAAVAARMVPAALGTQTAGSVLRPAAYCGIVGFKPGYGLISRRGVFPLSWTLDHVGVLSRTVEDAGLLYAILAGVRPLQWAKQAQPPRLGQLTALVEAAQAPVAASVTQAAGRLQAAGASVRPLELPVDMELLQAVHHLTMAAEAAAVHQEIFARHRAHYRPRIRALVQAGAGVPATVYLKAQRLRRRLRRAVEPLFRQVDALLLPTTSDAVPHRDTTGDLSYQAPWSLLGLPALTLPAGLDAEGLPVGLQLVGPPGGEEVLLRAAGWCEGVLTG